jgi:hypothetical protein
MKCPDELAVMTTCDEFRPRQMAITATAFVALTVLSVSIYKRRDSDVEALPYYEALAS